MACWGSDGAPQQLSQKDFRCMCLFLIVGSIFNTRLLSLTLFYLEYFEYFNLVTENDLFFNFQNCLLYKSYIKVKCYKVLKMLHSCIFE